MANLISNALGTEQQFMSQPDSLKVGGVPDISIPLSASKSEGLTSLEALAATVPAAYNAYNDYTMKHEQNLQEIGLTGATDMINTASQHDDMRLSTLDMAQQYGYMNLSDNPYFKAYADNMRGKYFSQRMQEAYNDTYATTPAKSVDEEQQRISDFSSQYLQKIGLGDMQVNQYAFNQGYAATNKDFVSAKAQAWVNKDTDDQKQIVLNGIKSGIGDLVFNQPSMSAEDFQKAFSGLFNAATLSGLDSSQRTTLANYAINELAKTGRMSTTDIKALADKTNIITRMDGSTVPLSQVVDIDAYNQLAIGYQQAHLSQMKLDFINKHSKDATPDAMMSDLTKLQTSKNPYDRNTYEILSQEEPKIIAMQKEWQAKLAAQAKEAAKLAITGMKKTAIGQMVATNMSDWINVGGMNDSTGQAYGKVHTSDGTEAKGVDYQNAFWSTISSLENNQNMSEEEKNDAMTKLMTYPGISGIKDNIVNQLAFTMDSLKGGDLDNGVVPDSVIRMVKMRQYNSGAFDGVFGTTLGAKVAAVQRFTDMSSLSGTDAIASGLRSYLAYKDLDDATKQSNKQAIAYYTSNGHDIQDIKELNGTMGKDVGWDNPSVQPYLEIAAQSYMAGGMSAQDAVNAAANDVQENFVYVGNAIIPKGVFYTHAGGTSAINQSLGSQAIYAWIYDYAETLGVEPDAIDVQYNPNSSEFKLSCGGNSKSYRVDQLHSEMEYIANNG